MLVALACSQSSADGNFEMGTVDGMICISSFGSFYIGPPKSKFISTLGSLHGYIGLNFVERMTGFKFLAFLMQGVHLLVLVSKFWFMYCPRHGWPYPSSPNFRGACLLMTSIKASFIACGMSSLSSIHRQPVLTCVSGQKE